MVRLYGSKYLILFVLAVVAMLQLLPGTACATEGEGVDMKALFPEIDGWVKDGEPVIYDSENLFEYINGAADLYLSYDFQELATVTFEKDEDASVTIEIYRHSTARNTFGIYGRERPSETSYLHIGTQAYYEKGMLNMLLGHYYVKMLAFGVKEKEMTLLTQFAKDIADRIGEDPKLPTVLRCFPWQTRIKNTEQFIAHNFLGHSFLHSAFTNEYLKDYETFKVFLIEAKDEEDAKQMVQRYLEMVKGKGESPGEEKDRYRFVDPYHTSSGKMNLMQNHKYIWGLFTDDQELADHMLETIEENLRNTRFIPRHY